jgi:hypothetical protein
VPRYDETEIAELVGLLRPAPEASVAAAIELPRTRRELERLLPVLERDAEIRAEMTRDLEAAVRRAGFAPEDRLISALRRHLDSGGREDRAPERRLEM